jgi:hypothetical protein
MFPRPRSPQPGRTVSFVPWRRPRYTITAPRSDRCAKGAGSAERLAGRPMLHPVAEGVDAGGAAAPPPKAVRPWRNGFRQAILPITGVASPPRRDTAMTSSASPSSPPARRDRLRPHNLAMGLLHLVQGVVVLVLATDFTLPVVATFISGPPGAAAPAVEPLFEVRIAWGVALFFFLSAVAHLLIVSPGIYRWYRSNLERQRNYARWIEYSLSSSVMIVLIAMLVGIADLAALLALAGVNASMILFGLLQEKYETPGASAGWLPFWFGVIAGAIPWIAIAVYLFGPGFDPGAPGFVYGIFFSLFVFFNLFAVVMVLQYRQVGRWVDYAFGESTYVLLSLVAKSALAWQVFGGTLAG